MSIQNGKAGRLTAREMAGGILALIGATMGAVSLKLFLSSYQPLIQGNAAKDNLSGAKMLTGLYPAINDIAMLSGVIFLIAAFGYFTKKNYAWFLSIFAATAGLLASWMAFVWPLMIQLPITYVFVFMILLAVWLALVLYVRPIGIRIVSIALIGGIAFVLNFMNGTAALNKLIGIKAPIFFGTQQLNWFAAVGFAIFTIALLYRKHWAIPLGMGAGVLSLIAGIPLSYLDTAKSGETSMFWIAVIASGILVLILLFFGNKLLDDVKATEQSKATTAV